jgi:AAA domain
MSHSKLNKIGIIGTQCIGKSTLVDDMILQWPQLCKPQKTYRDLIKEKKLPVNKNGTKESQQAILNFLVDEAMANYGNKKIIFDRTPIDNLVYSLWLYDKGVTDIDEDFIDKSIIQAREAIKSYSIIFYIPLTKENDVLLQIKENRDIDPIYRGEIAVLFDTIYRAWESGASRFFDTEDRTPIIPLYGTPLERIAMANLYINEKCEFFGEEDSLIKGDIAEQQMLADQLGLTDKKQFKL